MSRSSHRSEWRIGDRWYAVRFDRAVDCARTVRFDGSDPALFGASSPVRGPLVVGAWVGRVDEGAPVNVDRLELVPHCHGTHTESAGHLSAASLPVTDVLSPGPVPATLVTIPARSAASPNDEVDVVLRAEAGPAYRTGDRVVTLKALESALVGTDPGFLTGLVLRIGVTEDLDPSPTYLTAPAAERVARIGVRHLVLELPSIDRPDDGGLLAAHRAWWGMDGARGAAPSPDRRAATLTELALVPPGTPDGSYLLDLHTPALATDAVPSRPLLYPVDKASHHR